MAEVAGNDQRALGSRRYGAEVIDHGIESGPPGDIMCGIYNTPDRGRLAYIAFQKVNNRLHVISAPYAFENTPTLHPIRAKTIKFDG